MDWAGRYIHGSEQELVREKVGWVLIRLGAGKMLGREWMDMMEEAAEEAGEVLKVGEIQVVLSF